MWALLVVTTAVGAYITAYVVAFIAWAAFSTCNEPPDPVRAAAGQKYLAALFALVWGPWLLAAVWIRPRVRVIVAGFLCASPALYALLGHSLNPNTFGGHWCLF